MVQQIVATTLLVLSLCAVYARREPHGGTYATLLLDHSGVVDCILRTTDRNHDTQLNRVELEYTIKRYVSSREGMLSGLDTARLIRQCDFDYDERISHAELERRPFCLSTAQHEAWVRYVCNRALHTNAAYRDYIVHLQRTGAMFSNASIAQLVHASQEMMQKDIAPYGDSIHMRVNGLPNDELDSIKNTHLRLPLLIIGIMLLPFVFVCATIAACI